MEITVTNWDKYNPKRDQKSYTWLRLNNDIGTQSDLFGMTAEMKFVWILILCEVSRKNNKTITIKEEYLAHTAQVSTKCIRDTVKYLKTEGIVACDISRPHDVVNTTPTNDTNDTNDTNERTNVQTEVCPVLDFETIYKFYPRKKGKTKGIEKIKKQVKNTEQFKKFKTAVNNFTLEHSVLGTEEQFIPHFSTFVSTWGDYLEENGWELPRGPVSKAQSIQDKNLSIIEKLKRERDEKNRG